MISSAADTPNITAFSKPPEKESASVMAQRISKTEEKENSYKQAEPVDKVKKTDLAEKGEIIQRTAKDIESEAVFATYTMKKQLEEQSHLLSDSPDRKVIRTNLTREEYLGKNLSVLV